MSSSRKNFNTGYKNVKDDFQFAVGKIFEKQYKGRDCNNSVFIKVLFCALCHVQSPPMTLQCRLPKSLKRPRRPRHRRRDPQNPSRIHPTAKTHQRHTFRTASQRIVQKTETTCHRPRPDFLSRQPLLQHQRDLSLTTQVRHESFSRLCHRLPPPQMFSLHHRPYAGYQGRSHGSPSEEGASNGSSNSVVPLVCDASCCSWAVDFRTCRPGRFFSDFFKIFPKNGRTTVKIGIIGGPGGVLAGFITTSFFLHPCFFGLKRFL